MKNIFKILLISSLFTGILSSCDDKTDLPYVDNPTFKEDFETNFPNWVKYSEVGAQVWTLDPTFGNPYPGACAKMSGYSGANNANVDWLISPVQDMSGYSSAQISFDNAYKFDGPVIELYVSRNYSGSGDPNASGVTWTKINGANLSPGNYSYVNSGKLDMSAFAGSGNEAVYVAFKYTSTTSASSTWEIDNVKIYGIN
ncbi:MAG: choice-of-anchor J domain-containing protein [Flavobacteriaceae bacterium]